MIELEFADPLFLRTPMGKWLKFNYQPNPPPPPYFRWWLLTMNCFWSSALFAMELGRPLNIILKQIWDGFKSLVFGSWAPFAQKFGFTFWKNTNTLFYCGVLFKWEFFIQIRASCLPISFHQKKRSKRQRWVQYRPFSFEWNALIWIGRQCKSGCKTWRNIFMMKTKLKKLSKTFT